MKKVFFVQPCHEGVDAERNRVDRHDAEVGRPEVQLVDVVELDEDDCSEDDQSGGDHQKDVGHVQELLVLGRLLLHHRQRRLLRAGSEHRHFRAKEVTNKNSIF